MSGGEVLGTVVETRQGIFCVDPEDQFVSKALIEHGAYGPDELRNLSNFVTPSSRVLMVGTHIGSLFVPLSKRVGAIVGVEANPITFRRLRLNVLMNQCHNASIHNLAASDSAGSIEFVMNRQNSGASKRMPLVKKDMYFYDQPEVTRVPSVRLDDLLPHERFDLVFMDIEGSEYFAMRGMPNILAQAKVVVSEFYPFMVQDVAGASVEQFLEPLEGFNTLIVPSLRKSVQRDEFRAVLDDMWARNKCDNGIIFLRDQVSITFGA